VSCGVLRLKKTSEKSSDQLSERWVARPFTGWPRDGDLSSHSPLFFSENKDRFLRQILIRDIQMLTGRPLAVYFASPFLISSISNEDTRRLSEVVEPFRGIPFDLLIETSGGETDATEGLVSMLRSVAPFRAIVPLRAKSNRTLICLAASEILMGPTSELGPIEPAIYGSSVSIWQEPAVKKTNHRIAVEAKFAARQTEELASRLLKNGMMNSHTAAEVKSAVNALCTRTNFASHGSVISSGEAKKIGLKVDVADPQSDLWRKLYLLHCMYSFDASFRRISKFFEQERNSYSVLGDDPVFNGGGEH
jgi:Serine dehydrogenase proteinase